MKLAFCDNQGELSSIAWAAQAQGIDIIYANNDPKYGKVLTGLVQKAKTEADIVKFEPDICYVSSDPRRASLLTKASEHMTVFGSTPFASRLETEELYAASLANMVGIKTPIIVKFPNGTEALQFWEREHEKDATKLWLVKVIYEDGTTTHSSESEEYTRTILNDARDTKGIKAVILQEDIKGIEISIEGWYNYRLRGKWTRPFISGFNTHKLMNDDVGPTICFMGGISWTWSGDEPKLFKQTLQKMEPQLELHKYVGMLKCTVILDYKSHQPYFLRWSTGKTAVMEGWLYNLEDSNIGKTLQSLALGTLDKYAVLQPFMGVLPLFAPRGENTPIFAPYHSDARLHTGNVYRSNGALRTCGGADWGNDYVRMLTAVANGHSPLEAMGEIYHDVIPQIHTTDLTYRSDIGDNAERQISLLEAWGYTVRKRLY